MYVHAEGQAVGKDTWSGGAHQSGAHRRLERCAHIHGAVCTAHTGRSVCTYKDQCTHIHGAVCALHIHGALCAHTQVEIVVVGTSGGADVVVSLGRGSETAGMQQRVE